MDLEVIEGEVFFLRMRKAKRETTKDILAERKKRLESLAQVCINDMHVMDVFLV